MDLRLSRGVRLLQRHPHLRVVPPERSRELERLRVLRPAIDRQIERALDRAGDEPRRRPRTLGARRPQTVDQAPWVPLVNPKVVDVLSKRVGNYQYSPVGSGC